MSEQNGAPQGLGELTKEEVAAVTKAFVGKCCPLGLVGLSIAGAQTQGALVTPLGQKAASGGELVACQGPMCMWFRFVAGPDGKKVSGDCVVPLMLQSMAMGLSQLPEQLTGQLAAVGKLRFTPNGG